MLHFNWDFSWPKWHTLKICACAIYEWVSDSHAFTLADSYQMFFARFLYFTFQCSSCLSYMFGIHINPTKQFYFKREKKMSVIKRLQTFCNLCNLTKEILSGKMSVVLCNYVSLSATQEQSLCQTDLLRLFNVYMQWFGLGVGCCVYICHQNQAWIRRLTSLSLQMHPLWHYHSECMICDISTTPNTSFLTLLFLQMHHLWHHDHSKHISVTSLSL